MTAGDEKEQKESTSHFYCDTCSCSLKDSQAWFDHLNGRKHNRLLGMTMVVERVTLDRVKARLAGLKRKRGGVQETAKKEESRSESEESEEEDEVIEVK